MTLTKSGLLVEYHNESSPVLAYETLEDRADSIEDWDDVLQNMPCVPSCFLQHRALARPSHQIAHG